jgi:hypothetical protein
MNYTLETVLFAILLLAGMVGFLEIGRRIGIRRVAVDAEGVREGAGAVEGAVFGLLGLLLAFTFSGAASRFDERRHLIVQEANAIGTAYLRLDLLPAQEQPPLRDLFRRYLDSRLAAYRKLPDLKAAMVELNHSTQLQREIWTRAVAASESEAARSARMLLIPALNEMFDITTTRTAARKMHPPAIIFVMLSTLSLVGSLLAGYGMARAKTRGWFHIFGFAIIMSVAVYVIIDLEFPRAGFIRVDSFDQVLVEVRESMN